MGQMAMNANFGPKVEGYSMVSGFHVSIIQQIICYFQKDGGNEFSRSSGKANFVISYYNFWEMSQQIQVVSLVFSQIWEKWT